MCYDSREQYLRLRTVVSMPSESVLVSAFRSVREVMVVEVPFPPAEFSEEHY